MWAHQKRKLRKEQRSEVELSNKFSFQHDKEEMVWKKPRIITLQKAREKSKTAF
ncbi:hypothetical protein LguiB_031426 [Lonicera macranthoides]